jgi:hypothetical protein
VPGLADARFSAKGHWWSANSAVLDVFSQDIDVSSGKTRDHDGHIVFDPAIPWLATRIGRGDADLILGKVGRLCERIYDSGH